MSNYMSSLPRTFSQRSTAVPPSTGAVPHIGSTHQFTWPSSLTARSTHQIRQAGIQARANSSGHQPSVVESFAQLRDDLTNDNFLSALGKFAVDDPARLDRLSLANLRENKRARNNLAALNAARTGVSRQTPQGGGGFILASSKILKSIFSAKKFKNTTSVNHNMLQKFCGIFNILPQTYNVVEKSGSRLFQTMDNCKC